MNSLRTKTLFADDRLSVVAIESIDLHTEYASRFCYLTASLKPVAIVVRQPGETYAIGMDAKPVDIDIDELSLTPDGVA